MTFQKTITFLAAALTAGAFGCAHQEPIETGLAPATQAVLSAHPQPSTVEAFVIDTATQDMPKSMALEGASDDETQTFSFPSFVLRWPQQGDLPERIVLIDGGFTDAAATAFGEKTQSIVWAAKPMSFKTTLAQALQSDVQKVELVLFTHMHNDHVVGLQSLCSALDAPAERAPQTTGDDVEALSKNEAQDDRKKVIAFLSDSQADHAKRSGLTLQGYETLQNLSCTDRIRVQLEGGRFTAVDDKRYPGLYVMRIAGHTPGTQVVLANTSTGWLLFVGDIVNAAGGYDTDAVHGHPKPYVYRTFVVAEDEAVLQGARKDLRLLRADVKVVVSHDRANLDESGLKPYSQKR